MVHDVALVALMALLALGAQGGPQQPGREEFLKVQNRLLRRLVQSLFSESGGGDDVGTEPLEDQWRPPGGPQQPPLTGSPLIVLQSFLVIPTPTWSTLVSTRVLQTATEYTEATKLPIIMRGKRLITTIYHSFMTTSNLTQVETCSTLITPTPTWQVTAVTLAPTASPTSGVRRRSHGRPRAGKRAAVVEEATVIEISKTTSNVEAIEKLRRLRQLNATLIDHDPFQLDLDPFNRDYDEYEYDNLLRPSFNPF